MADTAGVQNAPGDPPAPGELAELADLQAGLLDDARAAQLRRQVRADAPTAERLQALDRARAEVAALAADPAPAVPADVSARISAALRAERDPPTHRVTGVPDDQATHAVRVPVSRLRVAAATAGLVAAAAAALLGTRALNEPSVSSAPPTLATAEHITVTRPAPVIPMSAAQIAGLIAQPADFGPLGDPTRRAACLAGLGYSSSTRVLGARPVEINGTAGVLLLLPADRPGDLVAVAVALNCSSADTGLLADTTVPRP